MRVLHTLIDFPHAFTHYLRRLLSPAYREESALAALTDRAEFYRECQANDWAHALRLAGHACPVGTVLAGTTVTR